MFGTFLILVIIAAIVVLYSKVKAANNLMAIALAEPDPVVRQMKTEKAIQFAKTKNPFTRKQLRQAIEG